MVPLPLERPLDRERTTRALQQLVADHERIYGIFWATAESDPEGFVEGWLAAHTYKTLDSWFGNVRLVVYAVPAEPPAFDLIAESAHRTDYVLGKSIALQGYAVGDAPAGGDILPVTLYWQALDPIDQRFKVFVHLMDHRGLVVAQRDSEPGGGGAMTDQWTPGQQIADNHGVLIPPGTPPGEYTLRIGMYSMDDGSRLPIAMGEDGSGVGDALDLATVSVASSVAPPPLAALDMQQRVNKQWGGLELLGYSVHRLGQEHLALEAVPPGDVLRLTLFWRKEDESAAPAEFALTLRDRRYNLVWERGLAPTEGAYPFAAWRAGEIVRDIHAIHLPPDLANGDYVLNVAPAGQPEQGLTLRRLTIQR
jgi:mannosyltransferase